MSGAVTQPPGTVPALKPVAFIYLRHGETDWNREGRTQGRQDVPLNAAGLAQAAGARRYLESLGIRTICTSPLRRAHETAVILQQALACPITVVEDLAECAWGAGEGAVKGRWFTNWRSGAATPAGAEAYEAFLERALDGVNQALACVGPALIVGHGGVYWTVQRHARLDRDFELPNCRPVVHEPPGPDFPWWRARLLGSAAEPGE